MKNKPDTKQKLIHAVGEILKTKGFDKLKVSTISRLAGVDRKLIYRYFGNLHGLIEAYIIENDYWCLFADVLGDVSREVTTANIQQLIVAILQNQFRYFYEKDAMQRLILLEISQKNPLMQSIHNVRELRGQHFFELTKATFENSSIDLRPIAALLVGGIYYAVLHSKYNGGIISDIDIDTEDGQLKFLEAIKKIIDWTFEQATLEKKCD